MGARRRLPRAVVPPVTLGSPNNFPSSELSTTRKGTGLVRLVRYYTRPPWHLRPQYQACCNLPLSRARLWVVSQLSVDLRTDTPGEEARELATPNRTLARYNAPITGGIRHTSITALLYCLLCMHGATGATGTTTRLRTQLTQQTHGGETDTYTAHTHTPVPPCSPRSHSAHVHRMCEFVNTANLSSGNADQPTTQDPPSQLAAFLARRAVGAPRRAEIQRVARRGSTLDRSAQAAQAPRPTKPSERSLLGRENAEWNGARRGHTRRQRRPSNGGHEFSHSPLSCKSAGLAPTT